MAAAFAGDSGFVLQEAITGLVKPTAIAFRTDGAVLIAEFDGRVRVWQDSVLLSTPFIDLSDEVGSVWDRGLLGIALDPDFQVNGYVYLLYAVDEIFGPPEEPSSEATFARLTRYTADPHNGRNTALPGSRLVLLGVEPDEGFVSCGPSHTIGTLRFGLDGSLFVSAGDGASFTLVDDGGHHASCFLPDPFPGFGGDEDIGAFRAQWLDSMSGKVLRIDPGTGEGLPDNPFFTGDATDVRSKVWVSGLRNPFRLNVRPGTPSPGTLYIGDVGWHKFEEINVATGGENFGWPCFEGNGAQASYVEDASPAHSGCDTIETPQNPSPETGPIVWWSHSDSSQSFPPGFTGHCAVGGAFYTKANYPADFRGAFFLSDCIGGWVKAISVDGNDSFVAMMDAVSSEGTFVAIESHPVTGDLYIVDYAGSIRRLTYPDLSRTDLDEDGDTDLRDASIWMSCFSETMESLEPRCQRTDVNADEALDLADWRIVAENAS
ncbi:MAG: PQQ-dependent sugar dehydrogenase, partial [Candidatus Hydrogenedentes bacterium]|nr:PQQ-dependent sugar dehydrogenase [Candidatus Hydrogenedentota bacterium]